VRLLQKAMAINEGTGDDGDALSLQKILTTEEVSQVVEKHIESLIAKNPSVLGHQVTSVKRQVETDEGRIDLILYTKSSQVIVIEVKLHRIGRDAVKQLQTYMKWMRKGRQKQSVSGVIVCEGVLPAFADDVAKLKDIKVMCYGWQLSLYEWSRKT
jgi:RecB family endonuclease NucS